MESNSERKDFTPKKDAEGEHKKDLSTQYAITCTVEQENAEVKVRVSETCESSESDSDIEFLKEIPGTIQHHVFVHRKVKTEVKDVDQKESVNVKNRRNTSKSISCKSK